MEALDATIRCSLLAWYMSGSDVDFGFLIEALAKYRIALREARAE
jgi:hypothetical protein